MTYPKHIVAAMGIVRNNAAQILLIKSPRRGWEPPGGIVEEGEDLITGLRREIMEETGAEAEIGRLVAIYSNVADPPKLMLTFEATYLRGNLRPSDESPELGWFSAEQALEMVTHPAQRQKLQDALEADRLIYRVYQHPPYTLLHSAKI